MLTYRQNLEFVMPNVSRIVASSMLFLCMCAFAAQQPVPVVFKADPIKVDAGRKKAAEILCTMCHLGGFIGQNEMPRVAGQQYQYIVKQLEDFRARRRTNDAGSMTSVTTGLSDADIENLASYIVNLQ